MTIDTSLMTPLERERIDLTKDQTLAILDNCEHRTVKYYDEDWKQDSERVEILYENKWLHLCRADWAGQVHSWFDGMPLDGYRARVWKGARITDDAFYIIDSRTDG